jgi:hypothetical protein
MRCDPIFGASAVVDPTSIALETFRHVRWLYRWNVSWAADGPTGAARICRTQHGFPYSAAVLFPVVRVVE